MTLDDWMRGRDPQREGPGDLHLRLPGDLGRRPERAVAALCAAVHGRRRQRRRPPAPSCASITTGGGAQESRFVGGSQLDQREARRPPGQARRPAGAGAASSPRTATACASWPTARPSRRADVDPRRAARARVAAGLLAGAAQGQGGAAQGARPRQPDQGRGRLRPPVLARRRAQRPGRRRRRARRARSSTTRRPTARSACCSASSAAPRTRRGRSCRPTSAARRCSRTSPPSSAIRRAPPVDYIEQDWTKERWTRGCPVAHVAPGVLTKYGPWLRRAVGKVHFAGTETVRLLAGLHGRRRALGRARGPGGPRGAAPLTPGVHLLRDSFPERPALDIAVSHALLMRVARGELEPTVRLYRPAPTLAFGRLDALRPGFAEAGDAARDAGFQPIVRLAGGHAAAYHEQSLIYEEIVARARRDRRPARPLPRRRRPAGRRARRARRRDPGRRDPRRVLPRRLHGERGRAAQARGQRPARRARRRAAERLHPRRRRRPAARARSSTSTARWRSPGGRPPPGALDDVAPGVTRAVVEAAVLAARGEDRRADPARPSTPRRSRWRARWRSATAGPSTRAARDVRRTRSSIARAGASSIVSPERGSRGEARRSRMATAAHGRPASRPAATSTATSRGTQPSCAHAGRRVHGDRVGVVRVVGVAAQGQRPPGRDGVLVGQRVCAWWRAAPRR